MTKSWYYTVWAKTFRHACIHDIILHTTPHALEQVLLDHAAGHSGTYFLAGGRRIEVCVATNGNKLYACMPCVYMPTCMHMQQSFNTIAGLYLYYGCTILRMIESKCSDDKVGSFDTLIYQDHYQEQYCMTACAENTSEFNRAHEMLINIGWGL